MNKKYSILPRYSLNTLLFSTLCLIFFSSCSNLYDYNFNKSNEKDSSIDYYVLVSAKLPYLLSNNPSPLREEGTIGSDELSDITHKKGNFGESDVRRVRVIVANSAGVVVKNELFEPSSFIVADVPASSPNDLPYREITMKIKLVPDMYRFLIIANEPTEKTTDLNGVTTSFDGVRAVTESIDNLVYHPTNLNSSSSEDKYTIPMIGVSSTLISVPTAIPPSGDVNHPIPISPNIPIERVLSKVEFYATNSDDNNKVFPDASNLKLDRIILKNTVGRYNLFVDDTKALSADSFVKGAFAPTTFTGAATFTSMANSNMVCDLSNEMTVDGNKVTAPYKKMGDTPIFSYYMCERRDVSENTSCDMIIYLKDNNDASHKYTYTIKLRQKADDPSGVDYNIYRNRIYQVYATIKGDQLIGVKLLVRGWNPVSYTYDILASDLEDL